MANDKKIHITLFTRRDYDLVALSLCEDIKIGPLIKNALIAYVKGQNHKIIIPKHIPIVPKELTRKEIIFSLNLDDEYEKEVVLLFNSCKDRHKISVIKAIVRGYFVEPFLSCFLENEGIQMLEKISKKREETKQKETIEDDDSSVKEMLKKILENQNSVRFQQIVQKEEETTNFEEKPKANISKKIIIDTQVTKTNTSKNQNDVKEQQIEDDNDFDWMNAIDNMMMNF